MSEEATPKDAAPIGPAIPSNINKLGRYEAARYSVEALGWAIQPLHGPTQGRGREQGKKAIRKGWKHHTLEDATPEFIARYFGGKKQYNLGCTISGEFVHVDLDSKKDKGASVMGWLVELVRPHHVILTTARPDRWREATLDRIEQETGWQPNYACFAPRGWWNPPVIKKHLLRKDIFPVHGEEACYIAIESNSRTREMYSRFGIPCFWVTEEGSCLAECTRILKRLPRWNQ